MEKTGSYIKRARDLEVYKRAYAVSLDVHGATLASRKWSSTHWPTIASFQQGNLRQRFISMAMGSCSEVETWISYAFDLGYITQALRDEWLQSYAYIYGMLVNLREKLK